jgi:hypothetical protein
VGEGNWLEERTGQGNMGVIEGQLSIFEMYEEENRAPTLKIRNRKFAGSVKGGMTQPENHPDT